MPGSRFHGQGGCSMIEEGPVAERVEEVEVHEGDADELPLRMVF